MAKVIGIGGVFLKAAHGEAVKAWYARVLGFELTGWGGVVFPPLPPGGATVWSLFAEDSKHFAPSTGPVMLNLVVDDMDGVLARVRAEGVEVLEPEEDATGRFARLMDPTGMKLELWQPAHKPAPNPTSPSA